MAKNKTAADKPIVEIRAINFTWLSEDGEERENYRLEYRRQGETAWITFPVIERGGKPEDGRD